MKTILSLLLLFGCLFIAHTIYPYEEPCENQVTKQVDDTINLANYIELKDRQVAGLDIGEVYDFSHDFNLNPKNNPALSDGGFYAVDTIKGNDHSEIEPCLNCNFDFSPIGQFEKNKSTVPERVESLNTDLDQSYIYGIEWLDPLE